MALVGGQTRPLKQAAGWRRRCGRVGRIKKLKLQGDDN